jgi:hypothetical protein
VSVLRGGASRDKLVRVEGVAAVELQGLFHPRGSA